MARIGVVPSTELSAKDLRARKYVFSPKREAENVLRGWVKQYRHTTMRAPAIKDLQARIEEKLREAQRQR